MRVATALRWLPIVVAVASTVFLSGTAAWLVVVDPAPVVGTIVAVQAVVVLILTAWAVQVQQTRRVRA